MCASPATTFIKEVDMLFVIALIVTFMENVVRTLSRVFSRFVVCVEVTKPNGVLYVDRDLDLTVKPGDYHLWRRDRLRSSLSQCV